MGGNNRLTLTGPASEPSLGSHVLQLDIEINGEVGQRLIAILHGIVEHVPAITDWQPNPYRACFSSIISDIGAWPAVFSLL